MYVPLDVMLAFDMSLLGGTTTDLLKVSLDSFGQKNIVAEIDLSLPANDGQSERFVLIPQDLRNAVHALTFELTDRADDPNTAGNEADGIDATVEIDNVRFVPLFDGKSR